jgi:tetratricopeptide (TPR) repeat protein
MKQKALVIAGMAILLLLLACSSKPTDIPTDISLSDPPTPFVGVTPPPAPTASPVRPTITPTVIVTDAPTPKATVRLDERDVFCPTENDEAKEAFNAANDSRDKGEYPEAERLYLQAIELDPAYCDAMDNLGQLLRRQDRIDEAIGWYLKSLEIMPENTVALQNIALAYKMQGESEKAVDAYMRLVKMTPDNPEGYFGLGSIYYNLQQLEKAIEYLETAERLYIQEDSPYVSDAQYYLGFAHFDLQNCMKAKEYLEPIYDQFSENGGINYVLGVCYLSVKPADVKMAREYILKAQEAGIQIPADVLKAIKE